MGWLVARNNIKKSLNEALSIRYPMDTFEVQTVKLSIIPPGAKARVYAQKNEVVFDAHLIRNFLAADDEPKETIIDNYYETKTIHHYDEILKPNIELLSDYILSYNIDAIAIGEYSLNEAVGMYPVALHFLLNEEVKTSEDFVNTVESISKILKRAEYEGVEAFYFTSFPGSVPLTELKDLGIKSAWLTEPTPTPTPSPTPGAETTMQSSLETSETSLEISTTTPEEDKRPPAFAYQIAIIDTSRDITKDMIRNGTRAIPYSDRELTNLANTFNLSRDYRNALADARNKQNPGLKQTTKVTSSK